MRSRLTSRWPREYVFRGISQTDEGPAIQGGFDATCGIFYAGVWASNLDFGGDGAGNDIANIEIDFYAGIKPKTGRITWDLGVIYYAYPELQQSRLLDTRTMSSSRSAAAQRSGRTARSA